ncbi:MAG: radical SAM protein [Thermoanaerobaculia bacterium]
MKLLLINPRFPESFWSFKWAVDTVLPSKRSINPPLGLATLAALSPAGWTIEIVDENIESVPLAPDADLIGICGMGVQFPRQRELLSFYREKGYFVVAGGSYASLCPEKFDALADAVIAGEAEYIWGEFCADFALRAPRKLYRETGTVDLADSPVPRFDLLKLDRYTNATLQFSRGCPFTCEFCDIIVMFGRKPRTKSLEQVARELDTLRALGAKNLFFVDDNFIGDRRTARELVRFLGEYQREHRMPFRFGTEVSLNLAGDAGLLALFREANFQWVFIGIESPDAESLRETGKVQNMREDMLTSIRRIYAHGIEIFAGFIVGFDHDSESTFERQYRFIMRSGIQVAMVGLLTALPKTPLYERLRSEGRLIEGAAESDNTRLGTNVIPKRMSYDTMVRGYHELYLRLCSYRGIADRIRAKLPVLRRPLYSSREGMAKQAAIAWRFATRGLGRGGPGRIIHFLRTLAPATPRQVPMVISEWITGLAMRDYVVRNFRPHVEGDQRVASQGLARLQKRLAQYVDTGALKLKLENARAAMPHFSISLGTGVDRKGFRRTGRQLRRILRRSGSTVTLNIEDLRREQLPSLQKLLRRLSRYGDRISIAIAEQWRAMVEVDSSVFHLTLAD